MDVNKEYWRTIIHAPWRMDEWVFWIVIAIMTALNGVIIWLGIEFIKSF